MKTKMILLAALLSVAAMSANAGVRFGVSVGFPTPVVYAPASAPVTVVQAIPPCPGVGYVWAPGYWSYLQTGRVWVSGAWHYRAGDNDRGHDRDGHNHGGYDRGGHDRDHNGYRR